MSGSGLRAVLRPGGVLLIGYYGAANFGDDLMLSALISELDGRALTVFGYGPIPWLPGHVQVVQWSRNKPLENAHAFIRHLRYAQNVVWGGGTCFTDEDGNGLPQYMLLARLLRRRAIYWGVGFGRLNRFSRRALTWAGLMLAHTVAVRDRHSLLRARAYLRFPGGEVRLVEDPAVAVLRAAGRGDQDGVPGDICVAWRDLAAYSHLDANALLARVVDVLGQVVTVADPSDVVLIDADSTIDVAVNEQIVQRLKDRGISARHLRTRDPVEKLAVITHSRCVLTSRLHVAMAADRAGVPVLALDYSPKIEYFGSEASGDFKLISANQSADEWVKAFLAVLA